LILSVSDEQWTLWTSRIDTAIRFFLYVFIFWLPYSTAVIESCVITALILWIIKRSIVIFLKKHSKSSEPIWRTLCNAFQPKRSFIDRNVVFLLGICILASLNSSFAQVSFRALLTKTSEWFVIFYLMLEVFTERRHIFTAISILIGTACVTILDSLAQYYITYKDLFFGYGLVDGMRVTAGFKTPNGLAAFLTLFIPVSLSLAFLKIKNKRLVALLIAIFIFGVWSLILTFSRSAVFAVLVGLWAFLMFKGKRKIVQSICFLVVIFIGLAIFGKLGNNSEIFLKLKSRMNTVFWRVNVWEDSLQMIQERPILGHGLNTYMKLFQNYRRTVLHHPTYAHNCYLQMSTEIGLLGLIFFLWLIFKIFQQVYIIISDRLAGEKNLRILLIGLSSGVLAFLIHSAFDVNFYSLQLSAYLWLTIGLMACCCRLIQPMDEVQPQLQS